MNNTDWKSHYTKKCTTAEKAIQLIESFQTIFLAPMCNEPQVLVEEKVTVTRDFIIYHRFR